MDRTFTVKLVILLHILQIFAENKTDEIKELETQRNELLKEIHAAIDDSIKVMKDVNDTESELGVNYMTKLKEELDANTTNKHNETIDRRSGVDVYDLAEIFKKKRRKEKKLAGDANDVVVKKKIKEWLLQKMQEQNKIKEYREKQKLNVKEKCPRDGMGSRASRRKGNDGEDGRRGRRGKDSKEEKESIELRKSKRKKYPCCRKCCKKSYIGCL